MSGLLAVLPGVVRGGIPLPAGFFGTRIVAIMARDANSYGFISIESVTAVGVPDFGLPTRLDGDFTPTVFGRTLRFNSPANSTFDTTYPVCDLYVDAVLRATLTRQGSAGTRPSYALFNSNPEMGIVNNGRHVFDAFYRT